MSYEGYEQRLCANGHLSHVDAFDNDAGPCRCSAPIAWWNDVDQTNGDGADCVVELEESTPAIYESCPTCHHSKEIAEATYKIPDNAGHRVEAAK